MLARFLVLQVTTLAALAPTSPASSSFPLSLTSLSSPASSPSPFFRVHDASGRPGGMAFSQNSIGSLVRLHVREHVCSVRALAGRRPGEDPKKGRVFKTKPKPKGLFDEIRKDVRKEAMQQEKKKMMDDGFSQAKLEAYLRRRKQELKDLDADQVEALVAEKISKKKYSDEDEFEQDDVDKPEAGSERASLEVKKSDVNPRKKEKPTEQRVSQDAENEVDVPKKAKNKPETSYNGIKAVPALLQSKLEDEESMEKVENSFEAWKKARLSEVVKEAPNPPSANVETTNDDFVVTQKASASRDRPQDAKPAPARQEKPIQERLDELDEEDIEFFRARGLLAKEEKDSTANVQRIVVDNSNSRAQFEELGLTSKALLDNLNANGFFTPTPVQKSSFPRILEGSDIILSAYTGSGKTLAFVLPIVQKLLAQLDSLDRKGPSFLIVAPSRELAIQILRVVQSVIVGTELFATQAIGGANIQRQIEAIRNSRPHILVGTPGRIVELASKMGAKIRLQGVKYLIVDEVDQCLKKAMQSDLNLILQACSSPARQTIFASATGNVNNVKSLAQSSFRKEPLLLDLAGLRLPPQLRHCVIVTPRVKKIALVKKIFNLNGMTGLLVFVNDQRRVDIICDKLFENGLIAAPLKGDESKEDRKEVMRRLREGTLGEVPLVVATEIAARGIDIPGLSHVVSLDLPTDANHYVHRAGRTARGGAEGTSIVLCEPQEKFVVEKFCKELGLDFQYGQVYEQELIADEME